MAARKEAQDDCAFQKASDERYVWYMLGFVSCETNFVVRFMYVYVE